MNKRNYPKNWRKIRAETLERDNYTCRQCGVKQYAVGYFDASGRYVAVCGSALLDQLGHEGPEDKGPAGLALVKQQLPTIVETQPGYPWQIVYLAVAHLDQNTRNNDEKNLRSFCQRCHFAYDRRHNVPKLVDARKYGRKRGKNQLGFAFSTSLFDANKAPKPPPTPPESEESRPDLTRPSPKQTP